MDKSKAQKAKAKAKARSSSQTGADTGVTPLHQALAEHAARHAGDITPEVQAQQIDMQNKTQTVNPYHMMGSMQPNIYNPGNVVHGGLVPGSY